ncbi:type IV pilus biogenesis protein PilM [Texcoconibacillus texcoconensis]|uniref:Type IV pilus assembly protein PilM n=1 Tax=Texcoconibacillus texcoconensis TaxID=1095777 RepID=A0A840QSQ2_9BACI|nr:pilus assembly protein PilM [Texcoconibacillus texcoconensis]MBB5174394.1 type IV pilus assembly protein PilM [Texcoconibacillus texcoconensis]
MPILNRNQRTVLSFHDDVIRYAHSRRPDPKALIRHGEAPLPEGVIESGVIQDEKQFTDILKQCVKDWKLRRQEAYFHIPDSTVVLRKHKIPLDVPLEEAYGHLYSELGETLHLPFQQPVFDIYPLGEKEGERELLVFAAPEHVIETYQRALTKAGLKPVVADVSALSVFRLVEWLDLVTKEDHDLVIQFRGDAVNLSVFHQGIPYLMRYISFAESLRVVQDGESEDHEGDQLHLVSTIRTEIDKVLNFYRYSLHQGQKGVTRIVITGDSAIERELHREFSAEGYKVLPSMDEKTDEPYAILRTHNEVAGLILKNEV